MACAQTIYFIAQNYILLHCSNFIQNVILKHDRPRPCAALKPIKLHFTSINVILCVHLVPAKLHFARKNVIFLLVSSQEELHQELLQLQPGGAPGAAPPLSQQNYILLAQM